MNPRGSAGPKETYLQRIHSAPSAHGCEHSAAALPAALRPGAHEQWGGEPQHAAVLQGVEV